MFVNLEGEFPVLLVEVKSRKRETNLVGVRIKA